MIKLLNNADILNPFTDIGGVKLQSLAISYGLDKSFCTFWQQENEKSEVTAVIGKFGSAVTVSHKVADLKELADFLAFIGFSELVCSSELAEHFLGYSAEDINCVQKPINATGKILKPPTYNEYLKMHSIFTGSNTDAISIGGFEDWYVDISHRVRHGGAAAILAEHGCGIALLSKNAIIINGIAVAENHRGKGYGKEILSTLENIGNAKISMAFCRDSELPFYSKCGYKLKEKYSLLIKDS